MKKIKTKFHLIILLVSMQISACNFNYIPLEDLNKLKLHPPEYTAGYSLEIKGYFKCLTVVEVYIDDSDKPFYSFEFVGKIDTFISDDWYEEDMSFKVYPIECIAKDTKASVTFYEY